MTRSTVEFRVGSTKAGPYVGVAVICRIVEKAADGTTDLQGIIRTVDLDSPFFQSMLEATELKLVLGLRAGELRGRFTILVRGHYPGGTDGPTIAQEIEFTDAVPAATLIVPLRVVMVDVGSYWFDVFFEQRTITRIPLNAVRLQGRDELLPRW